jgi:hypothetical protein
MPSACTIVNIDPNDVMILPRDARRGRMTFSERTSGPALCATDCSTVRSSICWRKPRSSSRVGDAAITPCARTLHLRSAAHTRDLHPRAPGFAIWTSYAGRTHASTADNPKLTFRTDHSIGAGHEITQLNFGSASQGRTCFPYLRSSARPKRYFSSGPSNGGD